MKKYKYRKYFTYEGKRYSVYGDTLDEVYEKKQKKLAALREDKTIITNNILVKDWIEICIDTYKVNQKDITKKKYKLRIRKCITDKIGDIPLRSVRPIQCQQILNDLSGQSKTQINEIYNALRFIFGKAVDNRMIVSNPAASLVRPNGYRNHRRALTPYERKIFCQVCLEKEKYMYYALMLFCGCRPSEAAACFRNDVSISDGIPVLHIKGTKTEKSDRKVPIPPELYEKIKPIQHGELLAKTERGKPITENNRTRLWDSFKRDLNIAMGCRIYRNQLVPPYPLAEDLVPYNLRHEYCTELARRGVDTRVAQKLMGHSTIDLTANIYTNLDDTSVAEAAKKIYEYNSGSDKGSESRCAK